MLHWRQVLTVSSAAVMACPLALASETDTGYAYYVNGVTPTMRYFDKYAGAHVWYNSDPLLAQQMRTDIRYYQGSLGQGGFTRWRLNWQGEWAWHVPSNSWFLGERDESNQPGPWRFNQFYDAWYESGPLYGPPYGDVSDVITVFQLRFEDTRFTPPTVRCWEAHHRQVWFNPGSPYQAWAPWGTARLGAPNQEVSCTTGP